MLPYRHDKADELRSASALGAVAVMWEVETHHEIY